MHDITRVVGRSPWDCLAACAAMLAGEDLDAVYKEIGHDGAESNGFRFMEVARYLAGRDINLGLPCTDGGLIHYRMPTVYWKATDTALLIVAGRSKWDANHAVVLYQGKVLDPSPAAPPLAELGDYQVRQWWPAVVIR